MSTIDPAGNVFPSMVISFKNKLDTKGQEQMQLNATKAFYIHHKMKKRDIFIVKQLCDLVNFTY